MRPFAYKVEAGQASHSNTPTDYDAHNFFDIWYSEPVDIGTGAGFTAGSPTAANVRAENSFTAAAQHGGYIHSGTGPDAGKVVVEGYFSYPEDPGKILERYSREPISPNPITDSLYRPDKHRLRIFLSGFSVLTADPAIVDGKLWPGSHKNVTPPLGKTLTYTTNANIKDLAATPNTFAGNGASAITAYSGAEANFRRDWDSDPPVFSRSLNDPSLPPEYEIVPEDNLPTTPNVVRLEFFIQDNSIEGAAWEAMPPSHPDLRPSPPSPPSPPWLSAFRGIRDSLLFYPGFPDIHKAFSIGRTGDPLVDTHNVGYMTNVNSIIFTNMTPPNDAYFSLNLSSAPWLPRESLVVHYDHTKAWLTDLAGNLFESSTTPLPAYDSVPPKILTALAPVGGNTVYVRFTEMVFGTSVWPAQTVHPNRPIDNRRVIAPRDFSIRQAGVLTGRQVTGLTVISYGLPPGGTPQGVREAFLTLDGPPLTEDDVINLEIWGENPDVSSGGALYDFRGNQMDGPAVDAADRGRPITDVGLGVVTPLWASDGYLFDTSPADSSLSTIRNFSGAGRLRKADVILQSRIQASSPFDAANLTLYYDANVPSSLKGSGGFFPNIWMPRVIDGITGSANNQARSTSSYETNGPLRNFMLPEADPENLAGNSMEFIFILNTPGVPKRPFGLPLARLADPSDPRTLAPWSYRIEAPRAQRGGVSIYNNVINPNKGERTLVSYTLSSSGMSAVNVFSLDGSLVRVLHKGNQGAGGYNFYWDGKNSGGRAVARGIYFIRVVAPGIDQIRKVMVVK
jgi:hypothetical protein